MSKLSDFLYKNGRLPQVSLTVKPLDPSRPVTRVANFLSYSYQSSILIPVDTFSFTMRNPLAEGAIRDHVVEGDVAFLEAEGTVLATGIIDVVEIDTTEEGGEVVSIHGRDLLGQFEDQSAVSLAADPIWGNRVSLAQAIEILKRNTRIKGLRLQDAPTLQYLLATDPGENKISVLQRFCEPLNCIFWMDPDGTLVVGRPNMSSQQPAAGEIVMQREPRNTSNCINMKVTYAATQIPNVVLPLWAGQEVVQKRVSKEQALYNAADGPNRLRKFGHLVPRSVIVSTPRGADPQSLSEVNRYKVATTGGGNLLQAMAKRELARANVQEITVEANVPGHFNADLSPFRVDTQYMVRCPRASLEKRMYLYQVLYTFEEGRSSRTNLRFCNLGTIVADTRAR